MEEAIKGTQFWTMTCRGIEEQYEADAAEAAESSLRRAVALLKQLKRKKLKGLCDALMTKNHLVYHREDPIIEEVRTVTGGSSPPPCPPTLTPCPQCILSALTLC
eukprot:COSAG05_NODE_1245_length_5413_cov_6.208129_9_plen_105_part_00